MLYLIPFLHANIQYAEFHPRTAATLVERSYLPTLDFFAAHPELRAVFEYSGVTLELLAERWPEAIDLLRLLLERGQIELMGSTYANPILPLIPSDHARHHIARFIAIYDQLFGDLAIPRPQGIFLQEFAYDPSLAPLLAAAGYTYTLLTPRLLLSGLRQQLNLSAQPLPAESPSLAADGPELLHPLRLTGAQDATLAAFPMYRELIGLLFDYAYNRKPFDDVANLLRQVDAHAGDVPVLLFCGPSDAEFVGAYAALGKDSLSLEAFARFMQQVWELPFAGSLLPRDYLAAYPPAKSVYVPAGSSERSLDVWTADPDNARLNALCQEADQKLRLATVLHPENQLMLQEAWRAMLLAENSDGRGWVPCPERRLDCYNYALEAIALAETMLAGIKRPEASLPAKDALFIRRNDDEPSS